jgi:hypothetical protein
MRRLGAGSTCWPDGTGTRRASAVWARRFRFFKAIVAICFFEFDKAAPFFEHDVPSPPLMPEIAWLQNLAVFY